MAYFYSEDVWDDIAYDPRTEEEKREEAKKRAKELAEWEKKQAMIKDHLNDLKSAKMIANKRDQIWGGVRHFEPLSVSDDMVELRDLKTGEVVTLYNYFEFLEKVE